LLDLAVGAKLVEKKGAWFSYNDSLLGQGREAAKAALKAQPELASELESRLRGSVVPKVGQVLAKPVAIPPEIRVPEPVLPSQPAPIPDDDEPGFSVEVTVMS
jgi:recombination protein RecA